MKQDRQDIRKKRIVFVNQATGFITIDIVNEFAREFDEVAVVFGDIRVQDVALDARVKYSKVIEKSRVSNLRRFNRWFIASVQIFWLLLTKYSKFEIFYFSVPPFAYLSSLILRRRFSILMWDVYPDALAMAGVSNKNPVYRIWAGANNILFRRAYRIYTIGDVLKDQMSKYVAHDKIHVIPLWSGLSGCGIVEKAENPFICEHKLADKFIIQYSGNIGAGHNIETLLEAARITLSYNEIVYLIVGRGTKVEMVKKMISQYGLTNCLVLPFQPDNMIKYSLAAADLGVILVEDNIAQISIPSKIYNLMTVGCPILSITPENSEINNMIKRYGNGRNFEKDDVAGLAKFIIEMKTSPEMLQIYRERSLAASLEFTSANAHRFLEIYNSPKK